MIAYTLAALPVLIWSYLLLARGGFWRVRAPQGALPSPVAPRRVVAVIPARNEAAVIAAAVASLAQQAFNGSLEIIVVDDGSTDGTAEAASTGAGGAASRLSVLRGTALPPGWTGKLWALSQGVAAAAARNPDYLLFTDADIRHGRDSVGSLIAIAEARGCDLVSYMVRLSTAAAAERLLIPAFVFFFFKLYPPAWVASYRHRLAAAAGGCVLIRPAALERIGGLEAIRSRIIDDCSLARAVKDAGGRIWLGLTRDTYSLRGYGSYTQIGNMISRTAFAQLDHSYLVLAGTLLGLFFTYLLPVALLFTGNAVMVGLGVLALLLMSIGYLPMVRFYGLSPLRSLCLPPIAVFYLGAVIHSAVQYARGRGGRWKGRMQDV